jgi:hypothetical protein
MTLSKMLGLWGLPLAFLSIVVLLDVPICPSRVIFGLCCPGCGLTRACIALLQGDFSATLRFHPMALILAPMLGWMCIHGLLVSAGRIPPDTLWSLTRTTAKPLWIAVLIGLIGVWTGRAMGWLGPLPDPLFNPEQSLVFGGQWPDG